jgi:hypothetical protein
MQHEGIVITWRKCRHTVSFRVTLVLEKDWQIIFRHVPQHALLLSNSIPQVQRGGACIQPRAFRMKAASDARMTQALAVRTRSTTTPRLSPTASRAHRLGVHLDDRVGDAGRRERACQVLAIDAVARDHDVIAC